MLKQSNIGTDKISQLLKINILILVLVISIFQVGLYAYTEVKGIQAGIWSVTKSPYVVKGNILIPKGLVLKIEPGVVVKFAGSYQIMVDGGLIASGDKANPIVFTSLFDHEFGKINIAKSKIPQQSEWNGIEFLDDCDDYLTILNYCIIRYSKWCVRCSNAFPLITNVVLVDNYTRSLIINNQEFPFEPGQKISVMNQNNRPAIVPLPEPPEELDSEKIKHLWLDRHQVMEQEHIKVVQDSIQKALKIKPIFSKVGLITLNRELFDQLNLQSLHELFSYLPGCYSVSTIWRGPQLISRGIPPNLPDNRFMFLINGFPCYEPLGKTSFLELVPLDAIERVEISRGISLTQFNHHGVTGLANFIPRFSYLRQANECKIQLGDFGTRQLTAFLGLNRDSTFLNLTTKFMNTAGYWRTLPQDELGSSFRQKYANDLYHFSALVKHGSLSGFTGYVDQDLRQLGLIPPIQNAGLIHRRSVIFGLNKEMIITKQISAKIMGNYAHSYERMDIGNVGSSGPDESVNGNYLLSNGYSTSITVVSQYQTPIYWILTGAAVSQLKIKPLVEIRQANGDFSSNGNTNKSWQSPTYESSGFVEIGYNVSPVLGLLGKTYLNFINSGEKPICSVDAEIIYNPFLPLESYLRYTQTGRSATLLEKAIYVPDCYYGNSELKPEQFKQWEWSMDVHPSKNWTVGLVFYHLRTRNIIQLAPTNHFINNQHQFQTAGWEFSLQGKIRNKWFLLSNVAFSQPTHSEWMYPKFIATGLATVSWAHHFSTTTLIQCLSKIESKVNLGPYYLVHIILTYQLHPKIKLSVNSFDLLDQRPDNPDYIRDIIPAIPAGAGRSFYITLTIE